MHICSSHSFLSFSTRKSALLYMVALLLTTTLSLAYEVKLAGLALSSSDLSECDLA